MSGQREEIQDALFDWIDLVLRKDDLSCPIVWSASGGVRPKPPFISLQMIGSSRQGFPWKSGVDAETGERTHRHDMRRTVSIHAWGKSCMDRLDLIADSIHKSEYISSLRKRGLVVNAITDVQESAEDIANESETHGIFDIAVTYIRAVKEEIGWIEGVEIESDLPANSKIDIEIGGQTNGGN